MLNLLELLVDGVALHAWRKDRRSERWLWGCLWGSLGLAVLVVLGLLGLSFVLRPAA